MDKTAQKRSLVNVFSPLKYLSRKYLSARSDMYKNTLEVITKADSIFRDVIYKQKYYLSQMKSNKGDLSAIPFAQNVLAFLREQYVLIEITSGIRNEFAKIVDLNPNSLKDINYYITQEIGKTPSYNPNQIVENKIDLQKEWNMERPTLLQRMLNYNIEEPYVRLEEEQKEASINPYLIKKSFLTSWFWSKTESGKQLKRAFDVVYEGMEKIFAANINLLKNLDKLLTAGDPQAYWQHVKGQYGFGQIFRRFIENDVFLKSWNVFQNLLLQAKKEYEAKAKEDTETKKQQEETIRERMPTESDTDERGYLETLYSPREEEKTLVNTTEPSIRENRDTEYDSIEYLDTLHGE